MPRHSERVLVEGERRCGWRVAGGVYWTLDTEASGAPRHDLARFTLSPAIPVDPEAMGLSAIGVSTVERNGVTHVVDWVGESHYETPEAFLEEVARMGLSRRMPRTFRFDTLTEDSRILIVHRHGGGRNVPAIIASYPITELQVIRDATNLDLAPSRAQRIANTTRVPVRVTSA